MSEIKTGSNQHTNESTQKDLSQIQTKEFPFHGWLGLIMIAVFWWVNWGMEGMRTYWAFFPLWLGYILFVDALAVRIGRSSIVKKSRTFLLLFFISIPSWWIFEFVNDRVDYWRYLGQDVFTPFERNFWKTVCFSTVVPAVFVTANLFQGIKWFRMHHFQLQAGKTHAGRVSYFVIGWGMLAFVLLVPQYGMAFLWISLFFILDPINYWLKRPSILRQTAVGDWRTVILFFAATLFCGFFWELWNIYSWPKWIYTFPFLNGLKVFEMPLAGYLGYLPFGLELFAMVAFLAPWVNIEVLKFTGEMHIPE
jgi:hypothetical protein